MAPMLVVPNGWTVEMFDNFISNESIVRLRSTAAIGITQRAYEYGIPMHRLDNMEDALFQDVQRWIWMITGETPPKPNPEWKTPTAKSLLTKAIDEPWPKAEWTAMEKIIAKQQTKPTKVEKTEEPTLPPGLTRRIELE